MFYHDDTPECRPTWLSQALARLYKLPPELPPAEGAGQYAVDLLRSIEADRIPVPTLCVTTRGSVRIAWQDGPKELIVFVTGRASCRFVRLSRGDAMRQAATSRGPVDELREHVAWLYPSANAVVVRPARGGG